MEKIIKQLTTEAVREALQAVIFEEVSAKMAELMGDEAFTDKLEKITADKFHEAVTPEPQFKSVVEFVDDFIRPMYATTLNDQDTVNWSRRWYTHREAVARMSGLWRIYEIQRIKDKQHFLEEFLRVHADYHMRHLMADGSVFSRCSSSDTPSIPLPVISPATTTQSGAN